MIVSRILLLILVVAPFSRNQITTLLTGLPPSYCARIYFKKFLGAFAIVESGNALAVLQWDIGHF